jgi:peptidoglycan L-alanyl-D-glutamate endopeptidase CwlK
MTKYVKVSSGSVLNFRKLPSIDSEILGKLENECSVEVICDVDGWSNIVFGEIVGYVSSEYLTDATPSREMRDKVSVKRVESLHPAIREEVKDLIIKAEKLISSNRAVRIVQGLRTFEEQQALYDQGRTKPGPIVTNAKPGSSYHQYGLAIDFAILVDKDGNGTYDELSWDIKMDNDKDGTADWLEVVKVFEEAGYVWGGKWTSIKDYPHLQKTFGHSVKTLLAKYKAKQFITNTKYVKI